MPQHNEFHGEHGLHHTYPSSISTSISDTRLYGSNSGGVRPPQQQFHLPQPIEVDFRNYPHPLASSSTIWDSTLPNYGYPDTSHFRSNQDHVETPARSGTENPLLNWYTNNDGPWIPRGTVPDIPIDHNHSRSQPLGFRSTGSTTPIEPNHPREANTSENGGVPFVYLPSDSGYGTRRSFENASVFSSDVIDRNQDCSSLAGQGNVNQSFSTLKVLEQRPDSDITESWAGSQPASTGNQSRTELLHCPTCGKDVKTKSELKKHDLRHKKPFHCQHPGCTRKEGFSTTNDLDRHVRSKHPSDSPATPAKVHRCAFHQCKSQSKVWPRLDNFRCHIKRVHQLEGDQLESLVRRSEQHVRLHPSGSITQNYPRDARYQERNIQQREFLQDLTIQGPHHSEEPDNAVDDLFTRSRVLKSTGMLSSSNHVDFRSKAFGSNEIAPLPEHSLRHSRLEIDAEPSNVEANDHDVSIKQRNSPRTDSEQQGYQKALAQSSKSLQENIPGSGAAADPAANDTQTRSIAKSIHDIKELLEKQLERSRNAATLLENSLADTYPQKAGPKTSLAQPLQLSNQDLRTINSKSVEEMADIIKTLESLGHKIQKEELAEESKEPHTKKYPTPEPSEPEPTVPHPGVKSEKQVCKICLKFAGRPCQMRKHMKRHERPYGCTFLNCGKAFGSKNDWKRHENSQHFQSETWRCDEEKSIRLISTSTSTNSPCAKVFHRKESFKDHLIKGHELSDQSIVKDKLETCRIGRNCQSRFWCGFCHELKHLKKKGTDAWTERFNHIDDHFEGRKGLKKQSINEWLPLEEAEDSEPHGERRNPDDDDESESFSVSSQERDEVERGEAAPGSVSFNSVQWNSQGGRKRQNEDGESGRPVKTARRNRVTEERIICCQCQRLNNSAVLVGCTFCEDNHRFCDNCSLFEAYPYPKRSDI